MPIPVFAVKSFDSSTSALAGSHAAQHSVIVLPCARAGVVAAPMPSAAARAPPAAKSAFIRWFMRISDTTHKTISSEAISAVSTARVLLALQFQSNFILLQQFNFGMASLERVVR